MADITYVDPPYSDMWEKAKKEVVDIKVKKDVDNVPSFVRFGVAVEFSDGTSRMLAMRYAENLDTTEMHKHVYRQFKKEIERWLNDS